MPKPAKRKRVFIRALEYTVAAPRSIPIWPEAGTGREYPQFWTDRYCVAAENTENTVVAACGRKGANENQNGQP